MNYIVASPQIVTLSMSKADMRAAKVREERIRRDGFGFARAVPRMRRLYPNAGDAGLGEYGPREAYLCGCNEGDSTYHAHYPLDDRIAERREQAPGHGACARCHCVKFMGIA